MKKKILFSLGILCLSVVTALAQESNLVKGTLNDAEADRIIKKVTENEDAFRNALGNYVFNRSATIQTLGMGGQITGQYRRDSFMMINDDGRRFERITFFPVSTLTEVEISPEDLEDLGGVNPFALEPSMAAQYKFTYLGKEHIDELDLFVFDVAPKVVPDPRKTSQRFFIGRIWVDDKDLMIVKSKGKAAPETKKQKFPVVETWRENIDGKYWFPSFTSSDDELVFDNGQVVKLRVRVKYTDYRLGHTDVKILDDDDDTNNKEAKPAPTPAPKKP